MEQIDNENLKEELTENLKKLKEYRSDYTTNEHAVRTQLIEPVLESLGWKTSNPKYVKPNSPNEEGKIPDYILLKEGKSKLVVEAKNLSVELNDDKVINQIANYCYNPGIAFGILTNGAKWLLFNTFQKNPEDRIVWQGDLEKDEIKNVIRKLSSFSYDNIDKLEEYLETSKALESSWQALIESDDNVTNIVAKKLLERIKSINPNIKIDQTQIKTFVESKLISEYKLQEEGEAIHEDEEEEKEKIRGDEIFHEVEEYIYKKKKPREKITVTFPDKTKIDYRKVADTFVETIKKIGVEKIILLKIEPSGVPLVSEKKHDFYCQCQIGKYWIMTNIATKHKKNILYEINEKLKLNLKIESYMQE